MSDALRNARALLMAGRIEEAHVLLEALARERADDAETFAYLALALAELGRPDDAVRAAARAVEIAPHVPELHANLGDVLYRASRYQESGQAFEQALTLRPGAPVIMNKLGCTYRARASYATAEELFRAAVAAAPAFAAARINLGTLLLSEGNDTEGVGILEEVLRVPTLAAAERAEAQGALDLHRRERLLVPAIDAALSANDRQPIRDAVATHAASGEPFLPVLERFRDMVRRQRPDLVAHFAPLPEQAQVQELLPALEAHFAFKHDESAIDATLATLSRPDDGHPSSPEVADVRAYANAVRASAAFPAAPTSGIEWEAAIRFWHAVLTKHRPELMPGRFKVVENYVQSNPALRRAPPGQVVATLRAFFDEIHPQFAPGPYAAAAAYLVIVDLHAFADANGRTGRFVMNRLLAQGGLHPVFNLPTFRGDLRGVLARTREGRDLAPLLQALVQTAAESARFARQCAGTASHRRDG